MLKNRVIPCLLLAGNRIVKTRRFRNPVYIGDPVNTVLIFNEKCADELILLDINTSPHGAKPNFSLLKTIANQCFMPLCYGGGIGEIDDIKKLVALGIEKIALNTQAVMNPELISQAANYTGSQSVVVSIDAKKTVWGKYRVYIRGGSRRLPLDPVDMALRAERAGAGEILINSIGRDGSGNGYDLDLIRMITSAVRIPVIACGGAGKIEDLAAAIKIGGASAVAAGSLFIFQGVHRAVLVSYITSDQLQPYLE